MTSSSIDVDVADRGRSAAEDRVREFLSAHREARTDGLIATAEHHDGMGLALAVLQTRDLDTLLTLVPARSPGPRTWVSVGPPYPTGINVTGWHAIERTVPDDDQVHGVTLCEQVATVVPRRGPLTHAHPRACPACVWTVAIRGTDGALDDELARLRANGPAERAEHTARGLDPDLCADLATAVLAAADRSDDGYELDHPHTVALLAAITTHRPTTIVDGDCAEQGCDHDERADEQACPVIGLVCSACSLQSGGWAGEWEGRYEPECTVAGPCSVLTALADHYGVPTGPAAGSR